MRYLVVNRAFVPAPTGHGFLPAQILEPAPGQPVRDSAGRVYQVMPNGSLVRVGLTVKGAPAISEDRMAVARREAKRRLRPAA